MGDDACVSAEHNHTQSTFCCLPEDCIDICMLLDVAASTSSLRPSTSSTWHSNVHHVCIAASDNHSLLLKMQCTRHALAAQVTSPCTACELPCKKCIGILSAVLHAGACMMLSACQVLAIFQKAIRT